MLIYIDESGDPGVGRGSRFLVLTMVMFPDTKSAQQTSLMIDDFRHRSGFHREFKFSKLRDNLKDEFFTAIMPRNFRVKAWSADMHLLSVSERERPSLDASAVYLFSLSQLLKMTEISRAQIFIDGQSTAFMKRQLQTLRRTFNHNQPQSILSIEARDSKQNNLIQLADMVSGAIARSFYP